MYFTPKIEKYAFFITKPKQMENKIGKISSKYELYLKLGKY